MCNTRPLKYTTKQLVEPYLDQDITTCYKAHIAQLGTNLPNYVLTKLIPVVIDTPCKLDRYLAFQGLTEIVYGRNISDWPPFGMAELPDLPPGANRSPSRTAICLLPETVTAPGG